MKRFFITIVLSFVLSVWAGIGAFAQKPVPYLSQESVPDSKVVLPEPPKLGSVEFLVDEYYYQNMKLLRDTPRGEQAKDDARLGEALLDQFAESFGLLVTKEGMPETYELLMRSEQTFGTYGVKSAKNFYERIRPYAYYGEHSLTPDDEKWLAPNHSYPSGHSAIFYGFSYILCSLNPERQEQILLRGEEGAFSRVIAGCHWLSDTKASRVIAAGVYAHLQTDEEYLEQFHKAQAEVAAALGKASVSSGK